MVYVVQFPEVDHIGTQPAQAFFETFDRSGGIAAGFLGHQEYALAIAVGERPPHTLFAQTTGITPRIVEEVDACIDRFAH